MVAVLKKILKVSAALLVAAGLGYGAATLVLGFWGHAARPLPQACLEAAPGAAGDIGLLPAAATRLPVPDLDADLESPCPLITIAVLSNGAHTDFLLPAAVPLPTKGARALNGAAASKGGAKAIAPQLLWGDIFPVPAELKFYGASLYIYIGWGERDFYLNTPTWRDVRPGPLLRAAVGGPAALHVEYGPAPDLAGLEPNYAILRLTPAEYADLARFILSYTQAGPDGRALRINAPGYGPYDAFYEAGGSFSLFNTCNTWTAHALAAAGQAVPRWTNLAWFVLHHLRDGAWPAP